MTARKTTKTAKPKPRSASGPTLEQRVAVLEGAGEYNGEWLEEINKRLDALEARKDLRDKSHDEPVSNAGEAIGQHFRITGEVKRPWWRRILIGMGEA